jgi:hypothetical protein
MYIFCKYLGCTLKEQLAKLTEKFNIDTKYYDDRINTLTTLLSESLAVPTFPNLTNIDIDPRPLISKYDNSVADSTYKCISLSDWKDVLNKIKSVMDIKYKAEISDCDDFALIFAGMLARSTIKSEYSKQLAFGIAWSRTHAYNLFIDSNKKCWIYEPQNNVIIGELGKTKEPYNTVELWFMS